MRWADMDRRSMTERTRPRKQVTLAADVAAYLNQPEVNASRLVELAVRQHVADGRIAAAARQAGVPDEHIKDQL